MAERLSCTAKTSQKIPILQLVIIRMVSTAGLRIKPMWKCRSEAGDMEKLARVAILQKKNDIDLLIKKFTFAMDRINELAP